ncbi:MAG TPA: glycerophosphodiester phosphodiesterase family protein [Chryseosolibacter sp.]|nr:glycerophosphodiester phosphodiesterase family protein [Chryseosolibacter sp.]
MAMPVAARHLVITLLLLLPALAGRRLYPVHADLSVIDAPSRQTVSRVFPLVSAHRGDSRLAPENTLASFSAAIAAGADFIELDVRTTSDGHQVCLHDPSLKRTTGFDALVKDVPFEKVRTLFATYRSGLSREKVPSLEEVCQLAARQNKTGNHPIALYVDCKDIRVSQVIQIMTRYSLLDSAVFYGNVSTLTDIRELAPSARLLPAYPGEEREDEVIAALDPFAFDVAWPVVTPGLVKRCHAKGVKVFCDLLDEYDTPENYSKAIAVGVDLIQTDNITAVNDCITEFEKHRSQ